MRRRKPPPDPSPLVDEWADVPPVELEEARRVWWREYNRVRAVLGNPAPWVEAHPFPGGRGRYAHLRVPAAWRTDV